MKKRKIVMAGDHNDVHRRGDLYRWAYLVPLMLLLLSWSGHELLAAENAAVVSCLTQEGMRELESRVNKLRQSRGLRSVKTEARLYQASKLHSEEMARLGRLSHQGRDGSEPWDRAQKEGYPFRTIAENVAEGHRSVDAVVDGWIGSPPHYQNLLLPQATDLGAACAQRDRQGSRHYWTLLIGAPLLYER